MRTLMLIAIVLATTGFTSCTKRETIRVPGPVEYRDRLVVEPIPAELLREHPVATGPLAVCPQVAAARRAELEACNADKAALRARQEGETP
jgi:hypothetical protein